MNIVETNQLLLWLYSGILGLALGAVYDIVRITNITGKPTYARYVVKDIVFMLFSSVVTFIFLLVVNCGCIRLYLLFGETIGILLYRFTISRFVIKIVKAVIHIIKIVHNFVKDKTIKKVKKALKWIYRNTLKKIIDRLKSKLPADYRHKSKGEMYIFNKILKNFKKS